MLICLVLFFCLVHTVSAMEQQGLLTVSPSRILNAPNRSSKTPLHLAVESGAYEFMQLLLNAGAEVNVRDAYGYTPLHYAARNLMGDQSREFVRELIFYGADTDIIVEKNSALCFAVKKGCLEVVRLLLDNGAELYEAEDRNLKVNGLCSSAREGGYWLLEKNLEYIFELFRVIRYYSPDKKAKLELVLSLLKGNHLPLNCKLGGMSPLCLAVKIGLDEVVEILLKEKEIKIDLKTDTGECALEIAAQKGSLTLVELLTSAGASMDNLAPLYAVQEGCVDVVTFFADRNCLFDYIFDAHGKTVLHMASRKSLKSFVQQGRLRIIELLVRNFRSLIDKQTHDGQTALHFACLDGNDDAAELLLAHGACATIKTRDLGFTPLHLAILNRRSSIVEKLLKYAPESVNVLTAQGLSPLEIAQSKGYQDIAEAIDLIIHATGGSCSVVAQTEIIQRVPITEGTMKNIVEENARWVWEHEDTQIIKDMIADDVFEYFVELHFTKMMGPVQAKIAKNSFKFFISRSSSVKFFKECWFKLFTFLGTCCRAKRNH